MTDTLLTPSIITKDTLMILENNLVGAKRVNRQFENQFTKIGNQITVRKPNRFTVRKGPTLKVQDITEPSVALTINSQAGTDFEFSYADLTLTIEEFRERYIKPAAATIANQVDVDVLANYSGLYNAVGTAGTEPNSWGTSVSLVGRRLDDEAAPQNGRTLLLGPGAYWSITNALTSLYVQKVAEDALKGFLTNLGGFDIFQDQNAPTQTVGALGGTPLVDGASQTGSTLNTKGWSNSISGLLNVGDVFTIAGVYAVNPQSRKSTGVLRQFVVTAPASSNGSGKSGVSISPSLIGPNSDGSPSQYQTVSALPADGAAITVFGSAGSSYRQNMAFARDCIGLVMVPMAVPRGVDFAARETWKGMSLRIVCQYDINNDTQPCRLDVLYGTTVFYPEMGCRLTS